MMITIESIVLVISILMVFVYGEEKKDISNAGGDEFEAPGPNIALGKAYQWNVKPTYKYCTDPGDAEQLTDGKYVPGCSWTNKGTVGWNKMREPLFITIDLGQVQPIAGVSYETAGGSAEVYWPTTIMILVSNDGKTFYNAGELTQLSAIHAPAPTCGIHRYRTNQLTTFGRYVRLVITAPSYIFCDEIEVYRGDDRFLLQPRVGPPVTDVKQLISANATRRGIRRRVLWDIADMKKRVTNSGLSYSQKTQCLKTLEELMNQAMKLEVADEKTFRCIVPLNPLHAKVYALNAPILRLQGVEEFTVWHTCRWDPLAPLDVPTTGQTITLTIRMMLDEYRAETLNLTNPTDRAESVFISFEGLLGSPTPNWIEPHEVLYTDTMYGRILADALEPLSAKHGAYELTIPAGMTKQVWFRFHPTTIPPGDYEGRIVLTTDATTRSVPLRVHVSRLHFPKQVRCTQALWDYSDAPSYDFKILGDAGIDVAIKNMQNHFVNQTWAHSGAAGIPQTSDFYNDKNELVKPLNWSRFDRWIRRWGGRPRYYAVCLSFEGKKFAGATMGTSAFDARVCAWAAAWRRHVAEIGLDPSQIVVLVVDEYSTDEQAAHILKWCKPIKTGYPEIQIMETVCQVRPDQSKVQELYDLIDIFCPPLSVYKKGGKPVKDFYAKQVARGAKLWIYQNGVIENSDPYWHHRLQEWRCWNNGMAGTGFWAYCDAGDGGSWNPYVATAPHYSPVYISPGAIHDGKHWEAVREGIQDYEYLVLLRDYIAEAKKQGRSDDVVAHASKVLADAPKKVLLNDTPSRMVWWTPKDRDGADSEISIVLEALESLDEK